MLLPSAGAWQNVRELLLGQRSITLSMVPACPYSMQAGASSLCLLHRQAVRMQLTSSCRLPATQANLMLPHVCIPCYRYCNALTSCGLGAS